MRLKNGEVVLHWPLAGPVVVTAGWFYSDGSAHCANDYRAAVGTPVYAAEDGVVDQLQYWDGTTKTGMQSYGTMLRLCHAAYKGGVLQTRYAHLQEVCVAKGARVKEGQLLGYSGQSGNCYGAHLHFEVCWRGQRCNPLCWLDGAFTAADGRVKLWGSSEEHSVAREAAGEGEVPGAAGGAAGLQICTVGPMSAGDAMRFMELAAELAVCYTSRYSEEGENGR
ncbi:MAG: M23 family metallopeptidase [Gemmiger sp.]|nr:M23 family metallopeptidase [Gemmiger sp.]